MSRPGAPQDKLGVASLILGVVALVTSWVLIGIFFGIAAIVTGAIGRSRVKRYGAIGSKFATAGMVLGAVSIVAALVAVGWYVLAYTHHTEQHRQCKVYDTYQHC